jgi:hypothetical protein
MNLPDYNFIPAPLWLITVLHIVTLSLHFAAMNFLFGGLVVVLFGRLHDKWNDPTIRTMVKLFPSAVAATVTLGVAPLLFLQLVYYQQAYSAAIVSAWWWLAIVDSVIVAYYLFYASSFSAASKPQRLPIFLGIACFLLLFVSFVYSTVFSMAERPDLYRMLYAGNQSGTAVNTAVGSWIFRWLHMLLGAVGVGSFFVGVVGRNNEPAFKVAKTFFLWGIVATMVVGFAYMFTLGDHITPFMRSPAIWLVMVSLVLTLGAMHFFFKKKFVPAALMLFVSLVSMVTIRHLLRLIVLEGEFDPGTIPVSPQWSVFVMFLVCFVVMIGAVWYMLKLFFGDRRQAA